jgi:hypothetical protein
VKRTRTGQRRTAHPFPPPTGEPITAADVREGTTAFGPQAVLCRATLCAACFAAEWWRRHGGHLGNLVPPIDWTQLPLAPEGQRSEAHHEPPISNVCEAMRENGHISDDTCTLSLCLDHHGRQGDPPRRFAVRHSTRFHHDPRGFYIAANIIDYRGPRDEMRRRTAERARTA